MAVAAAAPKVEVQELYTWNATLTSDAPKQALVFKQKTPVKVNFVADTQRSPVKKSVALNGTVTLEAPGAAPVTVTSATVGFFGGGLCVRGPSIPPAACRSLSPTTQKATRPTHIPPTSTTLHPHPPGRRL